MKRVIYDFLLLTKKQFASSDFDAEHPVWKWLIENEGVDDASAVWLSFLYMAFYDEASAWVVFNNSDPFSVPKLLDLPIGKNRRNLWGGRIRQHFESLKSCYYSAKEWPKHNFSGEPSKDWFRLKETLGEVWGNGRFAQYTTAEMLQKVNGFSVEVRDFDNKNSSGPADGVFKLFGCSKDVPTLDSYAEQALGLVVKSGLAPTYTTVDRGVVESVLCNFSGICRGVFYSGRNLDRQQLRINTVENLGHNLDILWIARADVFRTEDLGEANGWFGISKERLLRYKQTGEIPWVYEGR